MKQKNKSNAYSIATILGIISLVCLFSQVYTSTSQVKISNENQLCVYTLANGNKVDVTRLRNEKEDYRFDVGRYSYRANFCGPLIHGCTYSITSAAIFLKCKLYIIFYIYYKSILIQNLPLFTFF